MCTGFWSQNCKMLPDSSATLRAVVFLFLATWNGSKQMSILLSANNLVQEKSVIIDIVTGFRVIYFIHRWDYDQGRRYQACSLAILLRLQWQTAVPRQHVTTWMPSWCPHTGEVIFHDLIREYARTYFRNKILDILDQSHDHFQLIFFFIMEWSCVDLFTNMEYGWTVMKSVTWMCAIFLPRYACG